MEQMPRRRPHNSTIGAFREPPADSQSTPYDNYDRDNYDRAERRHFGSHDPMPLFLSDPESEPDPQEFSMPSGRRRSITGRLLAVTLAAAAAAVLAAMFHSDFGRVLIANAKVLVGVAMAEQPAPPPSNQAVAQQTPSKDPTRMTGGAITLARADAREVAAAQTPSREAIANAYQSALRTPAAPPAVAAAAAPEPAPAPAPVPAKTIDPETLAMLINRAKSLIAVGDIAPARLFLERAANAQDAGAAFLLAETYDPAVLGTREIRTITPDPALAREWYQKAARLGSSDAQTRLAQLQN